jgi:hypothetical protein
MADDQTFKDVADEVGAGTMVISVDSTRRSPSLILKNTGVTIVSNDPAIGINVDDSGISFQGKIAFSSSGKNISKGIYTENDKSAKPYTYKETVVVEAAIKGAAYEQLGKQGIDISSFTKDGIIPIITDVSAGPLPHMHTIKAFQHVHKVEPAYLYRISPVLSCLKETIKSFKSHLSS